MFLHSHHNEAPSTCHIYPFSSVVEEEVPCTAIEETHAVVPAGAAHITSWYSKMNRDQFYLPASSIHIMTGLAVN